MPTPSDYAALLVVPYGVYLICKGLSLLGAVYVAHELVCVLAGVLEGLAEESGKYWEDE